MKTLSQRARDVMNEAHAFRHGLFPAKAKQVVDESAELVHELAQRLETLEQKVVENEQTAK